MNIRKTIYASMLLMTLGANSYAVDICDANLTEQSPGFKTAWQGVATVQSIKSNQCPEQAWHKKFDIKINPAAENRYCQTAGVIPVPNGFFISDVGLNNGTNFTNCGNLGEDEFTLGKFASNTHQVYLIPDGHQKLPEGYILSTYVDKKCNSSSFCYARVRVVEKGNNKIWCNNNGNATVDITYINSGNVSGYRLLPGTGNCSLGAAPSPSYGKAFELQSFDAGDMDQNTCASKYTDFDRSFVAIQEIDSTTCGGNYKYYKVKRPGILRTACVINGTYGHPIGYVIKNKQAANSTCPDGRYDVVQVSGNTISNVCAAETKIPDGYYLSSNVGSPQCSAVFKRVSGSGNISGVCLSSQTQPTDYPGWYPSGTTLNTACDFGRSFTLSQVTDESHEVVWYNSTWVPEGYVIVPRTGSCTSPMTCNKIQVASGGMEFCHGSYAIPDGYKKGEELTPASGSGMGCPNRMTKYRLLVDQPPPANSENLPDTFKEIEPEVNSKPSNMADIGVNCPSSNC